MTDAKRWQKLTLPLARWAKNWEREKDFVDHCLFWSFFSFGHCVVCPSIYEFWLPFFGIFKLFFLPFVFFIFAKVCVIWYSHVTKLNAFLQKYNILLNISDVINMCTLKWPTSIHRRTSKDRSFDLDGSTNPRAFLK